ncbi:putative membrane-associated kinase regulator 4 [Senna tora]|uniref:Putative membrane-associated kinase regulator 4 n=1 Tax=Senna tora TaxID=362788 RepID=A0A834SY62_9FABA|nr:putative membrane-associated kinase regulator 4 [Senna tora]
MPSSSSSPADLLFYKGKLLPLDHLLLHHHQNSNFLTTENDCAFEESSCNNVVSPSGSCRFSSSAVKLDTLDDFESDCSEKYSTHDDDHVNVMKSTKRIMKNSSNSSLGKKLRAWLGKASCKYYEAYHHHHHVIKVADEASVSKANRSGFPFQSNYFNEKKALYSTIANLKEKS